MLADLTSEEQGIFDRWPINHPSSPIGSNCLFSTHAALKKRSPLTGQSQVRQDRIRVLLKVCCTEADILV
ncbi:MAG: hypothetical protein D3919_10315 [Candidatus Electrothrix sp. AW5]|nr:hypothetical protein [Candidatus Electrothrix gigas]